MTMRSEDSIAASTLSSRFEGGTTVKIHTEGSGDVNIPIPKGRRIQVSLELDASGEIIRFGAIPSTIDEGDEEDSSQENKVERSQPSGISSSRERRQESSFDEEKFRTPPSTPPQPFLNTQQIMTNRLPLQPRLQKEPVNGCEIDDHSPLLHPTTPTKQILPVIPSLKTNSTTLSTPPNAEEISAFNTDYFSSVGYGGGNDGGTTPLSALDCKEAGDDQSQEVVAADDQSQEVVPADDLSRDVIAADEQSQEVIAADDQSQEVIAEIVPHEPFVMTATERCDSMSSFGMRSYIVRDADIFRQPVDPPGPAPAIPKKNSPKKKSHTLTTKILTTQEVLVKPEKSVDTRAAEAAAMGMLEFNDRRNDRYELLGRVVDFGDPNQPFDDDMSTTSSVTQSYALNPGHANACPHCHGHPSSCTRNNQENITREEPDMMSDVIDLLARTCVAKVSKGAKKWGMLQPYHSVKTIKGNGRRINKCSLGRSDSSKDEFTVVSSSYAWRG